MVPQAAGNLPAFSGSVAAIREFSYIPRQSTSLLPATWTSVDFAESPRPQDAHRTKHCVGFEPDHSAQITRIQKFGRSSDVMDRVSRTPVQDQNRENDGNEARLWSVRELAERVGFELFRVL